MRTSFVLLSMGSALAATLFLACGGGDDSASGPDDGTDSGGGSDAPIGANDAAPPSDAGHVNDASSGTDSGTDAGTDSGVDAGTKITVQGRITDALGSGRPGKVSIGGTVLTTGADGRFTASNVSVPYDILVVASGAVEVDEWVGLTSATPVFSTAPFASASTATISGSVTGGHNGFPQTDGMSFAVLVWGQHDQGEGPTTFGSGNPGTYSVSPNWSTDFTSDSLSSFTLQYFRPGFAMPDIYYTTASATLGTVNAGGSITSNTALTALATNHTLAVSTTLPTGYTMSKYTLSIKPSATATSVVDFTQSSTSSTISCKTPPIAGGTASLAFRAQAADGSSTYVKKDGFSLSTDVTLAIGSADVPLPVTLNAPLAAATMVDTTTTFTTTVGTATPFYWITLYGGAGQPRFTVYSAAPTFHIPDASALGITLPSGASYNWYVVSNRDAAGVDAWATLAGNQALTRGAISATRAFTTK